MLVLTRKENEAVQVGDGVTIRVISIRGKTVKIGIDAPAEVEVNRAEILEVAK